MVVLKHIDGSLAKFTRLSPSLVTAHHFIAAGEAEDLSLIHI